MDKPKVGIVTIYKANYNYGGLLQAYALQRAIAKQGYLCEQLYYDYSVQYKVPQPSPLLRAKQKSKEAFQAGISAGIKFIARKFLEKAFSRLTRKNTLKRIACFRKFERAIPHSAKTYTSENMKTALAEYNAFVCGGDQIWNEWSGWMDEKAIDCFTLKFVPESVLKFSYAPSTGALSFSEKHASALKSGLSGLDLISVREASSVPLVEKLSGKEALAVLDPALLLTRQEWDELARTTATAQKKLYAVCYFLGGDTMQRKASTRFCHRQNIKTLIFPYISPGVSKAKDFCWGDIRDFTSGPAEFVSLIRGAEFVLTDSFHAIVFSMIYHKNFYVFERGTKVAGKTMNSRIQDFLEEFGLKERLISAEQLSAKTTVDPIDYTFADEVLEKRREESLDYLKKALSIRK